MALKQSDFLLTDEQLHEINRHFSAMADAHAQAGEEAPQSIRVTFEFAPVFGRTVMAYFGGAVNGQLISDECESEETEATHAGMEDSAVSERAEDRLAKHGFFLNDELRGTTEGEQLAATLGDIFKSMKEGSQDEG